MRASQRSHISAAVDRWLAEGLITPEQAQQMRTDIDSRPISPPPEVPATGKKSDGTQQHFPVIIIEALGYLGGAIIVVALGLLVSYFWSDLSTVGQLVLIAAVFGILLGAGWQFLNNLEHLRSGCAQSCGWLQRSRGHASSGSPLTTTRDFTMNGWPRLPLGVPSLLDYCFGTCIANHFNRSPSLFRCSLASASVPTSLKVATLNPTIPAGRVQPFGS